MRLQRVITEGVKAIAPTAAVAGNTVVADLMTSPAVTVEPTSIRAYILKGNVLSLLTAPVIYSLLVPFVMVDLWVTLYQSICFPMYRIARVPRRRYFALDRHRLAYLNGIEKVNCTFCSYANGLLAYVREVAARTEQYWCPIRHARTIPGPHRRYRFFFDYGDAERYRRELGPLREALRRGRSGPDRSHAPRRRGARTGGPNA